MGAQLEGPNEHVFRTLLDRGPSNSLTVALQTWRPSPALRPRVIGHVRAGTTGALIALARTQQAEDVDMLRAAITHGTAHALDALAVFPHPELLAEAQRQLRIRGTAAPAHRRWRTDLKNALAHADDPAFIPLRLQLWHSHGLDAVLPEDRQ